ncbi:MAG: TonB-dependent receptor plug domain-containing protein, partial [Rikenellaceae bacterium]
MNLTGSVSTVKSEDLESRPVQNVTQALQGVVPGLNVSVNSSGGELGGAMNINIRGAGTIGDGSKSSPLVLIDGIEGDMNSINPQDIENISVLKDAAAASIYGSRAPFGVILITTKKGKQGKATVNYNNSFRLSSPIKLQSTLDSYRFALYFNEAAQNEGENPIFDSETIGRIQAYQKGEISTGTVATPNGDRWDYYQRSNGNEDWFKNHYKPSSFSQEHNLSINGGGEKTQYYLSGNILDQDGLLRYSDDRFSRYAFTAKINT